MMYFKIQEQQKEGKTREREWNYIEQNTAPQVALQ